MRILVCGGRNYSDRERVEQVLLEHQVKAAPATLTLIHGAAVGADKLAESVAKELGWEIQAFRANWLRWGTGAGPIRNREMIDRGKPDLVIAFPGGRGTEDMVKRAEKAGIPVRRVT